MKKNWGGKIDEINMCVLFLYYTVDWNVFINELVGKCFNTREYVIKASSRILFFDNVFICGCVYTL